MTASGQTPGMQAPRLPGGTAKLAGRRRRPDRVRRRCSWSGQPCGGTRRSPSCARRPAAGVNHIDTAHFYGSVQRPDPRGAGALPGGAGAGQQGRRRPGRRRRLVPAQRPEQLRDQVEANLATLGVEQVGVVNLRRLDARPGLIADGRPAGRPRRSARRAVRAAGGGQDRRHRPVATSPPASSARRCRPGSPACRTPTASSTARPSPCSTCAASTASPGSRSSRSARPSRTGPR